MNTLNTFTSISVNQFGVLFGGIVFAIGLIWLVAFAWQARGVNTKVKAKVIDVQHSDWYSPKSGVHHGYAPVLEYEFGGKTYRTVGNQNFISWRKGYTIPIKIDPNNPTRIMMRKDHLGLVIAIALLAVGSFLIVGLMMVN